MHGYYVLQEDFSKTGFKKEVSHIRNRELHRQLKGWRELGVFKTNESTRLPMTVFYILK